jgi:hypothetical protein
MLSLAAMLGLQAAGGLVNTLVGQTVGKQKYGGLNPEDIKDKIVISPNKAQGMVADEVAAMNDANAANRLGVLQTNAPTGAKLASMRNIAGQAAKQRGAIEGKVKKLQHKSMLDYLNILNSYKQGVAGAENANRAALGTGIGQTLGSMGSTALLWSAGLLPNLGEQNATTIPDTTGDKGKMLMVDD